MGNVDFDDTKQEQEFQV